MKENGFTGIPKSVWTSMKEGVVRMEDDFMFGAVDEAGKPINMLPVMFTNELKDMSQLSTDASASLIAYTEMALNFSTKNDIIDVLELTRDVVGARKPNLLTANDTPKKRTIRILGLELSKPLQGEDSKATKTYQRLNSYYDMIVYGHLKKDEGTFFNRTKTITEEQYTALTEKAREGFEKQENDSEVVYVKKVGLDKAKTIDMFSKYVAMNNLALNVYAGFQNVIYGNTMIRLEAFAGEHIGHKDLLYGDMTYAKLVPYSMAEIGQRDKNSRLNLWIEEFDVLQDWKEYVYGHNMDRKSVASQLLEGSSLYFVNHLGEHYMQSKISLAMANRVKLKDKEGNSISI